MSRSLHRTDRDVGQRDRFERPTGLALSWLPAVLGPTGVLYICPTALRPMFNNADFHATFPGLQELSCLTFFWLLVGAAQWWAFRRLFPRAMNWGIMTFLGGLIATGAYHVAGRLLVPTWADLFGVAPKPVGIGLFLIGTSTLHQTLFFALQGMFFGVILGTLQSLSVPFRCLQRVTFVIVSLFAGAVALGFVWIVHWSVISSVTLPNPLLGPTLRAIGVTKLMSPVVWIVYSLITGLCAIRFALGIKQWKDEMVASSFD